MDRPDWWDWELELTPHLLKRMIDRGFNETDLREMLGSATGCSPDLVAGRFDVSARFRGSDWVVAVEPGMLSRRLIAKAAYKLECG